ncbi:MAG: AAA family ATPase [Clostridium sp.]|nr:AAA family ATPase [Clostridium sp.]
MKKTKYDVGELLAAIDPAQLGYQEWLNVGMALKDEGLPVELWEDWSRRDSGRYHPGECAAKWQSFHGSAAPVTMGTVVQYAKELGWRPQPSLKEDRALDWEDVIGDQRESGGDTPTPNQSPSSPLWQEPADEEWQPAADLIRYLQTLFYDDERVGYVTHFRVFEEDGGKRFVPSKGAWDRTARQLIQKLQHCKGDEDIRQVLGDYPEEAGAYIRFNPLDGGGVKDSNVADFRYALVESDKQSIESQYALIRQLELPVACLVHSGGKSLHAIVRVEAASPEQYRERVRYLYAVCQKHGLEVDPANRNPARLSRLPGVLRNGRKQFLLATNIGKASWQEWQEWLLSVTDDLPEPESLLAVWDRLPELAPPLIGGVLRQGHKMLLAGPSKAGKSFALIELCCAIAEGRRWLGWQCAQGRVLYVNLELDRASCLHRFKDVYTRLGWPAESLHNIDIWNLRGNAVPMDQLAPKLIRRAAQKNYLAVIIDPIYKVITGDENSADQMANFCNQFDKVCTELGCAVIYCHHHSKGYQGSKRSMDRASGSGVFARDPDALLDLIELAAPPGQTGATAWRVEGTLREFPKFAPVNIWFDYPVHILDVTGCLQEVAPEADKPGWQKKAGESRQAKAEKQADNIWEAWQTCSKNGTVYIKDLMEQTGLSRNSIKNYIDKSGRLMRDVKTSEVRQKE